MTFREWLVAQRTSVRLAFLLRLLAMAVSSAMSLIWTRLLLQALGPGVYGVYLSFVGVTRLGGLGDLGITGALAIRAAQAFGRGEEASLQHFLAAARALLLSVTLSIAAFFLLSAPWLPDWLGFEEVAGAGPLSALFATGAVEVIVFLGAGYVASLNFANGTVAWPILPTLFCSQLGLASHWIAAHLGAPLWVQNLAITTSGALALVVTWWMLKISHPWLGDLMPLRFDSAVWRDLARTSGWTYLYSLCYAVYTSADRLLINAGFGASVVPAYLQNYKLGELLLQLILAAGFVSGPKITRWIASTVEADRERVVTELSRMNLFQTVLGVAAALFYLAINDTFIKLWLGEEYLVPLVWQFAFALNIAVTASNAACVQTSGACGRNGLRNAALTIGASGALNVALSFWAMKAQSIAGIAFATVVSQWLQGLAVSWLTLRYLSVPLSRWIWRTSVWPICIVAVGYGARIALPPQAGWNLASLLACDAGLLLLLAYLIGFRPSLIRQEWYNFRNIFKT